MPKMSQDRVKFTIPASRLSRDSNGDLMRGVVSKAFGECLGRCKWGDVTIICRPSQFARFLIYRNEAGLQNMFNELNAVLFTPEERQDTVFDVSENPSRK